MIINGQKISGGEHGPETMLGELVRIILVNIQEMRNRYITSLPLNSTKDIDILKKKNNLFADLDESQALSCSRDVLLSCNRTESGGDTYFAIESLLVNKEYAVLTPFASQEDPVEIIVDIVERKPNYQERFESEGSINISKSSELLSRKLSNNNNIKNNQNNNQDNDHNHQNHHNQINQNNISYSSQYSLEHHKSRIVDDYTDSSGPTFSVSTGEDENNKKKSLYYSNTPSSYSPILNKQNLTKDNGLNSIDASDL